MALCPCAGLTNSRTVSPTSSTRRSCGVQVLRTSGVAVGYDRFQKIDYTFHIRRQVHEPRNGGVTVVLLLITGYAIERHL
jgi:hypothetical protein